MSRLAPGRAEVRRDLLLLGVGAAVLFLLALGARDLWQPNEPTYGEAVREMHARGEWLLPTVNGTVFAEKPPLYYWAALVAARALGGVHEWSLRIPSALAGILGVLLTYLLVVPYAGRERARIAAALLATTYGYFWNSRSVQMDLLVTVSTLATILAVVRAADGGAPPARAWALAGLAAGIGFLAKGPVAWICPGIVIVVYLVATRRARMLATPSLLAGAGIAVGVVAPWLVALLATGHAGALREVLLRQNVTRFLEGWDHRGPWWYYLYYFWIDAAPWSWFVPLVPWLPDRDPEERRLDLLAWVWLAGVIAFFSLSSSKRSAYMLPAAPAVALLVSGLAERLLDGRLRGRAAAPALAIHGAAGVLSAAAGTFVLVRAVGEYPDLAVPGRALGWLLVAGGAAILAGLAVSRRSRSSVPAALFALVVSVYLVAVVAVLPAVNRYKSARPFCRQVEALVRPEQELASYRFWSWRASYAYYTGRAIKNLPSRQDLVAYLAEGERVYVIVEDDRLGEARSVLGDRRPLARASVGGTAAYLFSNR